MAQKATADGGNERNKTRFDDEFAADDLREGDRIDPILVATTPGQFGEPIVPAYPEHEGEGERQPDTQLVAMTIIDGRDDVHSALLTDGEGTIVRASRHDSQQAWSQAEADWTVREIGTEVVVEDVHELTPADGDDPAPDEREYIQGWVDVVVGDSAAGYLNEYSDDVTLNGSSIRLRDAENRMAYASISLR